MVKNISLCAVLLLGLCIKPGAVFSAEDCTPTVHIDPSSSTVGKGWKIYFKASTTCDGSTIPGSYRWSVETSVGSVIDANGVYTSGNDRGIDTVTVVDTLNNNVSAAARVEIWVCTPLQEALDALESDGQVTVSRVEVEEWDADSNFYYAFKPKRKEPTIGLIIYPGANADPRSYAPAARAVAEEGYLAVSVKMKLDLAMGESAKRANKIIDTYTGVTTWVIGGHSMGGVGASAFAKEFTDKVSGVFYWASYPSEFFRLDETDLKVISIYGTKDGIATIDEIMASKAHLPPDAEFVPIEGGNHSQFCWCEGEPAANDVPDITKEEQQSLVNQATIGFLKQFEQEPCAATYLLGGGDPKIRTLRQFRDTVLSRTPEGKALIRLYYLLSPLTVKAMKGDRVFQEKVRVMIDDAMPAIEAALRQAL